MGTQSTAAPRADRKAWADVTKGVAIILVVYYHASLYLQHYGIDGTIDRAKAVLELFPMPAFFLVAGLFGARMTTWTFRELWYRRLWPVLYLYLVWSVVRTVFYLVVPGVSGELGELPATHPLTLALLLVWPSSSYWFLYALFLFILLAWLLRRLPASVQVGLLAVVSTFFTTGLVQTPNLGWNRIGALAVFYVAGVVYSKQIVGWVGRTRPIAVVLALVAFLASAALLLFGFRGIPFLALAGQASAVALGVVASVYLARVRSLRFLGTAGVHTLHIYLLHLYVIVPVVALLGYLDPDWPPALNALTVVALTAFAIVASVRLARLTSRVRWLYVAPGWLGGPGRRKRTPSAGLPSREPKTHPPHEGERVPTPTGRDTVS